MVHRRKIAQTFRKFIGGCFFLLSESVIAMEHSMQFGRSYLLVGILNAVNL